MPYVPEEPTIEMLQAANDCPQFKIINAVLQLHQLRRQGDPPLGLGDTPHESALAEAYRAMLAAAPKTSIQGEINIWKSMWEDAEKEIEILRETLKRLAQK